MVNLYLIAYFLLEFLNNQNGHPLQLAGTSKNFQKKKKQQAVMKSDSEDSYSSSRHGRYKNNDKERSFSPSTPPPTLVRYQTAKRRKGIPHRAPFGGLTIEY